MIVQIVKNTLGGIALAGMLACAGLAIGYGFHIGIQIMGIALS